MQEANKGEGIHHYRTRLSSILKTFYVVVGLWIAYYAIMIVATLVMADFGDMDTDILEIFGDRRLFIIVQLTGLYSIICWAVAFFIYSLLIHSTHYEFLHFNEQVRSIKCDDERKTDEELCSYILKLMKIHNRLTECVKHLDQMFHRYAFIMIATIIPTTIFALFIIFRTPKTSTGWIPNQLMFSCPIIILCMFSFFALVNAPSQLHATIYNTKSSLCANTHIWFPYRPNVYHSALAFVAHLDQTNLGVSIWGFAVVSKPLVLTLFTSDDLVTDPIRNGDLSRALPSTRRLHSYSCITKRHSRYCYSLDEFERIVNLILLDFMFMYLTVGEEVPCAEGKSTRGLFNQQLLSQSPSRDRRRKAYGTLRGTVIIDSGTASTLTSSTITHRVAPFSCDRDNRTERAGAFQYV
ncbi:hypothetical protein PRIPAC_85833 [Pristionchus pacificus]|nr:hypothetical protein PRIPAC_85833 [Pristionchus pacificus]